MPKILRARAALDEKEERQLRKLATSRHGPADWIVRARMVMQSWDGLHFDCIAAELQCCEKTVRVYLKRFNEEGLDGLGDRPRPGRHTRLTEAERSSLIALARKPAPASLQRQKGGTLEARDEQASAQWSLDALTQAAHQVGIQVQRSQIRRILLREGVRWRTTHSWGNSDDAQFVRNPNGGRHALRRAAPRRDDGSRTDELGPVTPPHIRSCPRLVCGWAPYQGTSGILARTRQSLGVRSITRSRWASFNPLCSFTQLNQLHPDTTRY